MQTGADGKMADIEIFADAIADLEREVKCLDEQLDTEGMRSRDLHAAAAALQDAKQHILRQLAAVRKEVCTLECQAEDLACQADCNSTREATKCDGKQVRVPVML